MGSVGHATLESDKNISPGGMVVNTGITYSHVAPPLNADDESEFDVMRFFAARALLSNEEESDQGSNDPMPPLIDIKMEMDTPPAGYIDNPALVGMANIQLPASGDINMNIDIPENGFQCDECHNCTPHVVVVYCDSPSGTFHQIRTVCRRHALIENWLVSTGISQHEDESDDDPSDSEDLPELEPTTQEEDKNDP
jgi:hypothetical protein